MKRVFYAFLSTLILLMSFQTGVSANTPDREVTIDIRDDYYLELCEVAGVNSVECKNNYMEEKLLPEPITWEMVQACNNEDIWVWAGAFKTCIEEQLALKKDSGDLPLHPFVEGFLSSNEATLVLEKQEHFVNYYFNYISNPWYSNAWAMDIGAQVGAVLLIGVPTVLSNLFDMVKLIGTTIIMYFIKFTSADFLSSITKDTVQGVYDYLFVNGNLGIVLIGLLVLIAIVLGVLKLSGKFSFRRIGRIIVRGVIMGMVVYYTAFSLFTITDLAHKYIDPLVVKVFNLEGSSSELILKKQVFSIMIQQPYLIRNFGNGDYTDLEAKENEKGYEETFADRLANVLNDKDGAIKKEIETYKNTTISNNAGKAWLNLMVSLTSLLNGVVYFIIIMALLLPVAFLALITSFRPAYILFDFIPVIIALDFAKLFKRIGYLVIWGAIVTIAGLAVVSILVMLGKLISDIASVNYFFTFIFGAVILIALFFMIKFSEAWLPQAKPILQSAWAGVKDLWGARKAIDDSPFISMSDTMKQVQQTFSKEKDALKKANAKNDEKDEEKKPQIIEGEFTDIGSYSQEQEDLLNDEQLLLGTSVPSENEQKEGEIMKQASEKQVNYLNSLLDNKDYDESDTRIQSLLQGDYSMQEASDAINYLKNQPNKNISKPTLSDDEYRPQYQEVESERVDISEEEVVKMLRNLDGNPRKLAELGLSDISDADFLKWLENPEYRPQDAKTTDFGENIFDEVNFSDSDVPDEVGNDIDFSDYLNTLNLGDR